MQKYQGLHGKGNYMKTKNWFSKQVTVVGQYMIFWDACVLFLFLNRFEQKIMEWVFKSSVFYSFTLIITH